MGVYVKKCISCGKCPISIFLWAWGRNWKRWSCRHCGVLLKASLGTYLSVVVPVIALFIFSLFLVLMKNFDLVSFESIKLSLIIPYIAFFYHFFAGYNLDKNEIVQIAIQLFQEENMTIAGVEGLSVKENTLQEWLDEYQ